VLDVVPAKALLVGSVIEKTTKDIIIKNSDKDFFIFKKNFN